MPSPSTEPQIESLIDRLGDEGLAAIADMMKDVQESPDVKSDLGNLPGTQS
jgi:hypothetical protein